MPIKWICLLLATGAAFTAAGDELSWLDAYLSQPILQPRQTLVEAQIHLASRVKPVPPIAQSAQWDQYVQQLRGEILDRVVFRGEAAMWRDSAARVEWLDTLPGNGYRLKKFRYEALPGLWLAGLLYEPAQPNGRVPVVINLNGHEGEGKATPYIQERCINLAKK